MTDRAKSMAAGFETLYGSSDDMGYPDHLRVSAVNVEKSDMPHSWRRADPFSKGRAGMVRWICGKCGGWVDFTAGTKPNGHATPTCFQLTVEAVHGL